METMNKVQLRAACKAAGITGYGNMSNDAMRGALAAVAPALQPAAAPAPAASLAAAPVVRAPAAPSARREDKNGVTRPLPGGKCAAVWELQDEMGNLPATELRPRDLRLRFALAHDRHFTELRGVDGAPAGATLVVEDLRSGKLELVDTVARAHQVLLSLGAPDTLREFAFVAQWHALDDATRRARYSKYACHELHLFLHFRDPEFFARCELEGA